MPDPLRIRLCPAIAVEVAGAPVRGPDLGSRKARTLLARLAAARGRFVSVDQLVEALWPPATVPAAARPSDPAANVSTLVSRLRRRLAALHPAGDGRGGDLAVLAAPGRLYALPRSPAWRLDLDEAAGLLAAADLPRAGDDAAAAPAAAAAARAALDLLGEEPALVDEGDTSWVHPVRLEADLLRRRARHLYVAATVLSDPYEATRVAHDAVASDPFDEGAVRELMLALSRGGRRAEALRTFDDLAERLRDDLGAGPDSATARLRARILQGR